MNEVRARLLTALEGAFEDGETGEAKEPENLDAAIDAIIGADRELFDAAELGLAFFRLIDRLPPLAEPRISAIWEEGLSWWAEAKVKNRHRNGGKYGEVSLVTSVGRRGTLHETPLGAIEGLILALRG